MGTNTLFNLVIFTILALSLSIGFYLAAPRKNNPLEFPVYKNPTPTPTPSPRPPQVAGQFYPDSAERITSKLKSFLSQATTASPSGKPRIIVAPHAGLDFSGQTSAYSYKQILSHQYTKYILIASNHHYTYDHVAVYGAGAWQTPLRTTPINSDLSNSIIDPSLKIKNDPEVFNQDHTLEIQLLFLQHLKTSFSILPILIGQVNDATILNLSYKLAGVIDDQTLVVISTDWSHYPPVKLAESVDSASINAFLTMDKANFSSTVNQLETNHAQDNLQTAACGFQALGVGLELAQLLQIPEFHLLNYSNSAQTSDDQNRVVGYASIGGWSQSLPVTSLDQSAQEEALKIARQAIQSHLANIPTPPYSPQNQVLNFPLGAFVTLEKHDQLRGCIGHFEPAVPLYKVIQQSAVDAATNDPRFTPLTIDELSDTDIEISVLTPKTKISDWNQIRLGVDGVVVQKGFKSGTFLPSVATDTNWSKQEFMENLCTQKADLPKNCYLDPTVSLFTFQAQVFSE